MTLASSATTGLVIIACLYFLPTIVASVRKVRDRGSVIVINVFLGWTVIGWVVSLAMAARSAKLPRYDVR